MRWDRTASIAAGIIGAVITSTAAITDAVVGGVSHEGVPGALMFAAHIVAYVLLFPAAMAVRERHADGLGRVGRAAAAAFAASFPTMTVAFVGVAGVGETAAVVAAASLGFLLMFGGALVLGALLLRRTDATRLGALLLIAPLPLIPLVAGLDALGVLPAHPAAMEVAVYVGLAMVAAAPQARIATSVSPSSVR